MLGARWADAFLQDARPEFINADVRANAMQSANWILQTAFRQDPCFLLDSEGDAFWSCVESEFCPPGCGEAPCQISCG